MKGKDKNSEEITKELNEKRSSMIELEPTTTTQKPDLPDNVLTQWQGIIDLMAITCGVPWGLIMKAHPREIEVLVSAKVNNNPYHPGEKASLSTGLYCETVMSTRNRLLVPNALKDPKWDHNPDIHLGMISYLGYPLLWPDDDIYGTICILDNKENSYSVQIDEYVKLFRGNIENYLALLLEVNERKILEQENQKLIDELKMALSEVKKLSGFIPICSSCKNIRDDKGYWKEVERYIGEHSEAQFSHSVCPDCMRKLYPEYADEVLVQLEKNEKK